MTFTVPLFLNTIATDVLEGLPPPTVHKVQILHHYMAAIKMVIWRLTCDTVALAGK